MAVSREMTGQVLLASGTACMLLVPVIVFESTVTGGVLALLGGLLFSAGARVSWRA